MAINAYGDNVATNGIIQPQTPVVEDKTELSNDDFMTLLLVELQYQDPTEPTDTEQILTQTSQLASLEATDKTNAALEDLAASLSSSQEFSTIAAIGKMADTGSDAIIHEEGTSSTFEIYYPNDIANGTVDIIDNENNVVATLNIEIDEETGQRDSGVYQFTWDGITSDGENAEGGIYRIESNYTAPTGDTYTTRVGAYPIESVRFDSGTTLLKLGSTYVPIDQVQEVY